VTLRVLPRILYGVAEHRARVRILRSEVELFTTSRASPARKLLTPRVGHRLSSGMRLAVEDPRRRYWGVC